MHRSSGSDLHLRCNRSWLRRDGWETDRRGKILHDRDLGGVPGTALPPRRQEAVASVEAVCVWHGIQADRVSSAIASIGFRHHEHGGAKALPLPGVINGDESEDGSTIVLDVDPDGADDTPVGEKDQRMICGIVLVRIIGIVLEIVRRALAVVFLEQATPTDVVVANPFTRAPRSAELKTSRAHRAALLLFRERRLRAHSCRRGSLERRPLPNYEIPCVFPKRNRAILAWLIVGSSFGAPAKSCRRGYGRADRCPRFCASEPRAARPRAC